MRMFTGELNKYGPNAKRFYLANMPRDSFYDSDAHGGAGAIRRSRWNREVAPVTVPFVSCLRGHTAKGWVMKEERK